MATDMYERLYWEIQAVLDGVLGTGESGGEGGIVSDVHRALAKVRAEEREACLKILQAILAAQGWGEKSALAHKALQKAIDLIRARGET